MKRRDAQRRQDIETLQDVRSRLDFSVSRLNDVDTLCIVIKGRLTLCILSYKGG